MSENARADEKWSEYMRRYRVRWQRVLAQIHWTPAQGVWKPEISEQEKQARERDIQENKLPF